ncbi:MAG: helix-turn-helix transcriptional regulator [Candidatus Caldarchaeum sp.]|nr:helix-turn-helix transcriptional regulator [Candidatus Caldarchaeum sp.]MDW8434619.1 helix-turn-helix domain-containing protein [Candidatus Caldarchaeum sp.]
MAETPCEESGGVCPIVAAAKLLGSMWALVVISYLSTGPKGFNELLHLVPQLNSKTLARTLKTLQSRGLVNRTVVSTQPFAVSYSLTPMAEELAPILENLRKWGEKWLLPAQTKIPADVNQKPSPNRVTGRK